MNLRQIEVFRAVMATGSITKAATLLHVSQPGVSRLIRHLELQLGVALFERRTGRLVATPEAHTLQQEVDKVYRGVRQVQDVASNLRFGAHATLRVLSSANTALDLVPRAIARLLEKYPHAQVSFEAVPTREIVKSLVAEEADVAISSASLDHPVLDVQVFGQWTLMCALPPGHALANAKRLDLAAALRERLVLYSPEAPQSRIIDAWLAERDIARRRSVEVRSGYAACSMVAHGAGVAFVDDLSARAFQQGRLAIAAIPKAPRFDLLSVSNVNRPLSALGQTFLKMVREELRSLQATAL
ncbi:LysR family transcriptional regulator [Variovorax sp. KK3]|uniref:LysR family transcriptional regulator n=1 Tax=Variovorax sp. KK3 TaxID=1855728 RepID=UPI00097C2670|nr:LysR family transcriptional regulator [Variovorax sp. KK3]